MKDNSIFIFRMERFRAGMMRILFCCAVIWTHWCSGQVASSFKSPDLPPVLEFLDGRPVKSLEDWQARRNEIKQLWFETYLGNFPEHPPKLVKAALMDQKVREDGVAVCLYHLIFRGKKGLNLICKS